MDKIKELELKLEFVTGEARVDVLIELARKLYTTDLEKSDYYINQALELSKNEDYISGLANSKNLLAEIYYLKGSLDESEKSYQEALLIHESINDKSGIASCKRGIGRINWDRGSYSVALESYLDSIKICEEISDDLGMADSYTLLALYYYGRGDFDQAMEYLHKVNELQKKLGDLFKISLTYNRIGIIHKDKGEYDKALDNYFKALDIMSNTGDIKNIDSAIIFNNIGDSYDHLNDQDKAIKYYEKCREIGEEIGYKDAIMLSSINIGNSNLRLGNYDQALADLNKGLNLSRETGVKSYEVVCLGNLVDLYKARNDSDQALVYYELYAKLKEQLHNEEKNRQIAEMQTLYESEKSKREAEIYRLKNVELKKYQEHLEELVKDRTEELRLALEEVESLKNRLQAENIYLQEEIQLQHNFNEIVGRSKSLNDVLLKVEQVAASDSTVLILGETGTGKELIARAVHSISDRKDRPLVKVNCAALPANLIESELFGHEKGAFTGAYARKVGRFELAHNGTILLDEIGELPLELQAKLLRILQEGELERIGGTRLIKVDVRVIAVTNRDLEQAVEKGKFRSDLFYRLNVFPLIVPPLKSRKNDIPMLVNHFIIKYSKQLGKTIDQIPQDVMDIFNAYNWPGNIRELENIIERSVLTSTGSQFELGDWLPKSSPEVSKDTIQTLHEAEKEHILTALKQSSWRVSGDKGAAKILGLPPTTLESKMRKHGIKRPR